MCGIAGVWYFDGQAVDLGRFWASSEAIRHRGPDDEGYLLVDPVQGTVRSFAGPTTPADLALPQLPRGGPGAPLALGFRRLAILDLSPHGHQPMPDQGGRRWLIFNGEIYNYVELRSQLQASGRQFRSGSDTEVILAAYEEWGESCVERFNGMFAFAIWDSVTSTLFCARDRLGVKPFYYHLDRGRIVFASEIKALLPFLPQPKPDLPCLRRFLDTGLSDEGDRTFLEGVRALLPAHTMKVHQGTVTTRRYWDLDPEAAARRWNVAGGEEAFRELFTDSIRLRLRSDVPVGVCASGGIDSSSIVSLATEIGGRPLHTYSAVYDEPGYSEGDYVDVITKAAGSIATKVIPHPENWFDILPRLTWHQDGPSTAAGPYTQWHVMQAAQPQVTVLLDGQGGDELFAGYFRHFPALIRTLWQSGLRGRPMHAWRAATESLGLAWNWKSHFAYLNTGQFLRAAYQRKQNRAGRADENLYRGLLAEAAPLKPASITPPAGLDALNRALYTDVTTGSLPYILRFEDRSSMAFGLEARGPFLDYRVVEFALSLPGERKIRKSLPKTFLRNALRRSVPPAILARRDKKGYTTPWGVWMRGALKEQAWAFMQEEVLPRGWYSDDVVRRRWEDHQAYRHDYSAEFSRWMTMELWYRQVIEARGP